MMTSKLLSIIIPVYKVEAYINKCLDSLLVSPEWMEKLEVVIANDGTPENSAEMSREYVKRYPGTFRQIDKENGGHGSAWNVGLKEATGKYLRFLDSDDWFTNLDRLMSDLQESDADVVFNPFIKEFAYDNTAGAVSVDCAYPAGERVACHIRPLNGVTGGNKLTSYIVRYYAVDSMGTETKIQFLEHHL